MAKPVTPRRRRSVRPLEDLPGLFDSIDIDFTRDDIAGDIIAERHKAAEAARTRSVDIDPASLVRPDAIRFISFGSGSSGNCAYIGNSDGGLLIDAGVDNKQVERMLLENGIDIGNVNGILLTHDHNDHVRYAYALLRANRHMQLYCTPRAMNGLLRRHNVSRRISNYHKPIYKEFEFEAGGFRITPFETSHDGTDNVGFAIDRGDLHFVVATDLGYVGDRADFYMRRANYLMLESNYDLDMLRRGRYPEYLKARIIGQRGHLDNAEAAAWVRRTLSEQLAACGADVAAGSVPRPVLSHIFLCHLSNDNNTPEIACRVMRQAIESVGLTVGDASGSAVALAASLQLTALSRYAASPLYVLRR